MTPTLSPYDGDDAAADLAVTWYKQPQPAPAQNDLFDDGDPAAKQAALATAQGQQD